MIFSLRYSLARSVVLARLMLDIVSTAPACADIWSRINCKSGITLRSRPKVAALAAIKFQGLIGFNKGDPNNGYIKDSGSMVVLQTVAVSDSLASSCSIDDPGPVTARAALIPAVVGAVTFHTVSHSGLTSTVVGIILRWTS